MPYHHLVNALSEVRANVWKYSAPGLDKNGNEKKECDIMPLPTYDPAPIRGMKPPPRDSKTRIPINYQTETGYGSCDLTFNDLLKVNGLVLSGCLTLFAIMLENHAQHLVLDLDGDADVWPQLLGKEFEIETELRKLFAEFYESPEARHGAASGFNAALDMSAWRADRVPAPAVGRAKKTSIHVNHPGVAFTKQRDQKEFVLRFVKWLTVTHPGSILVNKEGALAVPGLPRIDDYKKVSPIDCAIYGRDRKMRMTYSRKYGPGKLPLVPMDPNTTLEDSLWASLTAYSMPADPALWHSYSVHTECDAVEPNSGASKKRKADAPLPQRVRTPAPIVVASAEGTDYENFKGTVCELPPKEGETAVSGRLDLPEKDASAEETSGGAAKDPRLSAMADQFASAMREEWDSTSFFKHMPHPKPADVKLIVAALDQEKRLRGINDTWRNVVWAVKAACPNDDGYAIVEEWTKGCRAGSKRPGTLMKTWLSGRTDRFTIAHLWKWVKEDRTGAEWRTLWTKINPPAVMEAARKASTDLNEGAVARVVESWQQTFGKRDEQKALVYKEDDGARELVYDVLHQMPQREVMRWWASVPAELIERITDAELLMRTMEKTVLPLCNTYWKMLMEKKQDRVFVKQACKQEGDDRKWRWLEMNEKRFLGAAHADFKLKGVHLPCQNMAHVWLTWSGRETYNGPACVPPNARKEHQPAPYQFNEWVGLRVSHARALKEGDAKHQDWIDFKDYLRNAFLQGEPDEKVKDYFCKWFISQFVRPGLKLKVALVMYSQLNQRGKGELIKVLGRLLGEVLVKQCESEHALDHFNEAVAAKLLIALDEFKRCKQYNERAKIEITEPTREVNGKNDKVYTEPNCANLAICTNEKDAVDVHVFSKRVFIVQVLDGIETVLQKADGTVVDYGKWKDRKWNDLHLAAGMLAYAEELDLDNWDPTDIPITEGAKLQMVAGEEKHDPVAAWWRKFLNDKSRVDEVTWDGWNSTAALFKIFKDDHADDRKVLQEASSNWFIERFAQRGFDKGNRRVTKAIREKAAFPEKQQMTQCFMLPKLETALAALNVKVRAGRVEDEE